VSRCILVIGTGRSGTSMVAGMLNQLGVKMGEKFMPADRNNPYGTFEDYELFQINWRVADKSLEPDALEPLLKKRCENDIWGFKDPRLIETAQHVIPMLEELGCDVRVVVCRRNRAETVNSYMRAYHRGRVLSERWYEESIRALAARMLELRCPVMELWFDEIMNNTEEEALELMHFVYEGNKLPSSVALHSAVKHVRKKPRKKVRGWGDLAIGVRVAKVPEPHFFVDWTKLLTGGLRERDSILMPEMFQPAHWAANKTVRNFVNSNKDSLLMIDDDMTFPMDAVHQLRENKENWKYDIVMAFCTRRGWPPYPIVYKLQEEKEAPRNLSGDPFHMTTDFNDGDVVEVDTTGLAFTLIRREVVEAMIDEQWGLNHTRFFKYEHEESEDISFCRRARELGFRIAVDTNVKIGHICHQPRGWEEFVIWRDSQPKNKNFVTDAEDLEPILEDAIAQGNAKARELLEKINE